MCRRAHALLKRIKRRFQWLSEAVTRSPKQRSPKHESCLRKSFFGKLPAETILLVMRYTTNDDLKNFIQTEKWTYQVFHQHKKSIFHSLQEYHFPEFSGWFGKMPGFDGLITDGTRTPDQIQCLKDAVYAFDWRSVTKDAVRDEAAKNFLRSLENHGGWRFLYFLESIQGHVERQAQHFFTKWHAEIPDLNEELAKTVALCFNRMSWNTTEAQGGGVETPGGMRRRVESRVRLFAQEPTIVRRIMKRTLRLITHRMATGLQLEDITGWYRRRYLIAGTSLLPFHHLASVTKTLTLTTNFFFCGFALALRLCEESMADDLVRTRSWIRGEFGRNFQQRLSGNIDQSLEEGSLWAEGLGVRTFGWVDNED